MNTKEVSNEKYQELLKRSMPLLEAYHKDLNVWDYQEIWKNPGIPFIHVTRKYGTHIYLHSSASTYPEKDILVPFLFGKADRTHILESSIQSLHHVLENMDWLKILYFDGSDFQEISETMAIELQKEYVKTIYQQWGVI
jgi:hypothetical protein